MPLLPQHLPFTLSLRCPMGQIGGGAAAGRAAAAFRHGQRHMRFRSTRHFPALPMPVACGQPPHPSFHPETQP